MVRSIRELVHGGGAAGLLYTPPIKIVSHVQEELGRVGGRALLDRLGDEDLRLVVHALHVAAARSAVPTVGLVARDELRVRAELPVVVLVPAAPREDGRPRPLAPAVRDDGRSAFGWVQGPVHSTPVSDREDVHLTSAWNRHCGPGHALVVQGAGWRLALDGRGTSAAAGALGARGSSAEAGVARRLAARAGRGAARGAAGRRAEEEPLEVAHGGVDVVHPGDVFHTSVPRGGVGVVLAAAGREAHGLLAGGVGGHVQGGALSTGRRRRPDHGPRCLHGWWGRRRGGRRRGGRNARIDAGVREVGRPPAHATALWGV
mmetsp:Transcript_22105/g.52021  ORF Transcript_22105/g.52021 Transcript_22105/m.52021 type:complete len:317 (+) Transcript_22105:898-1848(+)